MEEKKEEVKCHPPVLLMPMQLNVSSATAHIKTFQINAFKI